MSEMADIDEPWQSVAREPELGCYCKGKITLHVVDMLTYPRPVRKFEVLLFVGPLWQCSWPHVEVGPVFCGTCCSFCTLFGVSVLV